MKGIEFVVDDKGKKKAVLIDLLEWGELWEDFYDVLISESRKNEPKVSWEELEKEIELIDILKVDKKSFSLSSLSGESDDKAYWLSKTPHERLMATELMRQINYGYDPTTARLQKVLEIAELTRSYRRFGQPP